LVVRIPNFLGFFMSFSTMPFLAVAIGQRGHLPAARIDFPCISGGRLHMQKASRWQDNFECMNVLMATINVQRQQLIQAAVANSPGDATEVATRLWQPLASELVSIVGEGGFNALYARSLYLTNAAFPWLTAGKPPHTTDNWLTDLKANLEGQNAAEAYKANQMLLQIFTDILASLIGEPVTIGILGTAWSDDAAESSGVGKEFSNE
jgi:hypothetical protein